jgi:Spy/CpxP family protein refolding chaperone
MIEFANCVPLARRTLLIGGVLAGSCCVLWAQPDGPMGSPPDGSPPSEMQQQHPHGPSVDRELKRLNKLLALSTEQQTQAKAILTDQHQQMEALFKQSSSAAQSGSTSSNAASSDEQRPSREAMESMRSSMKAIRDDAHAKIAAILTDDQKAKYVAWEKKQQSKSRQDGDDMPPPPPDGDGGPPPDVGGGGGMGGPPGF